LHVPWEAQVKQSIPARILVLLTLCASSSGFAQVWPLPSKAPNAAVCAQCPGTAQGQYTYPYSAPILSGGRYLDSTATSDFQQSFRTGRANGVVVSPATHRVYFQIGSAVGAYDLDTFFGRVFSHETLWPASQVPVNPSPMCCRSGPNAGPELFLKWDQFFYAENTGSGWATPITDGQDRLAGLDVDDRGNLYLAYTVFGWGIVTDGFNTGGALMRRRFSRKGTAPDDVGGAAQVALIQLPTGISTRPYDYYAVIPGNTFSEVWNVNDPDNPVRQPNIAQTLWFGLAKTADRVAVLDATGVNIYTNDAFLGRTSRTAVRITPPYGVNFVSITTDGNLFYVLTQGILSGVPSVSTLAPADSSKSTYTRSDFPLPVAPFDVAPLGLSYGDGYLSVIVAGTHGMDLMLFRANGTQFTPIIGHDQYFSRYYSKSSTDTTLNRTYITPWASFFCGARTVKQGSKLYLIVPLNTLGDVYEIQAGDSLSGSLQGNVGVDNSNAPARPSSKPLYYGDKVGFAASSGSAKSVNWNFGNPQAASIGGVDPNAFSTTLVPASDGSYSAPASHRYAGLASLAASTTANVTDGTNSADVPVPFSTPEARIGVTNGTTSFKYINAKYLLALPNASAAAVVVGDSFFDGSDGEVAGHYAEWTLDSGSAVLNAPDQLFSTAAACGDHTLNFAAHYGPYDANFKTYGNYDPAGLGALSVALPPFRYKAGPFAAVIDPAYQVQTDSLVFRSLSRRSTQSGILADAEAAAVQWQWDLVNIASSPGAADTVLKSGLTWQSQSASAGIANVLPWSLPKSGISRGSRVRLTLNSPAALSGSCQILSSIAYSAPLNTPDPVVTGGCSTSQCSFTASSSSNTDVVADHWQFAWTVTAPGVPTLTGTGATFIPVFTQVGSYLVTVTLSVSNDIGTAPPIAVGTYNVTIAAPNCQLMTPSAVWLTLHGSDPLTCNASNSSGCKPGETLSFAPGVAGYDFGCGNHTFAWDFGDSSTASTKEATHAYAAGTYTVTMTISNPTQTNYKQTATITINSAVVTPPSCPKMTSSNIVVSYRNASGTCPGTCPSGDAITFGISGYDFSCAAYTITWSFGDIASASGVSAPHTYSTARTYTVSLSISSATDSYSTSFPVTISQGGDQTPTSCPPMIGLNTFITYSNVATGGVPCTPNNNSGCVAGQAINFQPGAGYDFTCGSPQFTWDFGDSNTATGMKVDHVFTLPKQYMVSMTVKNGSDIHTDTKIVNVVSSQGASILPTIKTEAVGVASYRFTADVGPSPPPGLRFNWVALNSSNVQVATVFGNPWLVSFTTSGVYTVKVTVYAADGTKVAESAPTSVDVPLSRLRRVRH
jgi:PKD repeat protein